MPTCFTHDVEYPDSSQCPVCRAEELADLQREMAERQREALDLARERQRDEATRLEEAIEREEQRLRDAEERARERARLEDERAEDASDRHDELVRLRELEIYKRTNPGAYKCPFCLNITLNRGASRCPICHGVIPADHWPAVYAAEAKQEEEEKRRRAEAAAEEARRKVAAAEEWARGAPERERQAQAAAEAAADAERKRQEDIRQRASEQFRRRLAGALGVAALLVAGVATLVYLIGAAERYKRSGPVRVPDAADKPSATDEDIQGESPIFRELPDYVGPEFREMLTAWLASQRVLRMAEVADCPMCPGEVDYFAERGSPVKHPFFLVHDLDADAVPDLAIVTIAPTKLDRFNAGLAIFRGPLRRSSKPSLVTKNYCNPVGAYLAYQSDRLVFCNDVIPVLETFRSASAQVSSTPIALATDEARLVDALPGRWGTPLEVPACPRQLLYRSEIKVRWLRNVDTQPSEGAIGGLCWPGSGPAQTVRFQSSDGQYGQVAVGVSQGNGESQLSIVDSKLAALLFGGR